MNFLQARQLFRSVSGRHDLVNADGTDNGGGFYLNEGRKHLDRHLFGANRKTPAICYRFCDVGSFAVQVPQCRAVKEVWVATTEERWQLEKKLLQDLKAAYMTELPSEIDTGDPLYYSPGIPRYIPEDAAPGDLEAFLGYVDVPAGDYYDITNIIIMPPPSEKVMVEIVGLFYSMELVNDTDKNYWSENHPLTLVMAAQRYIEVVNRNSQGVKDWDASIATEITQLDMDLVEELIAEVDQMEG